MSKLIFLISIGVFIVSRTVLELADRRLMFCAVSVCGPDHLPSVGGLIAASLFFIGATRSVKGGGR